MSVLLYVLGIALVSTGIVIIILTYSTKVFYTNVKSIKAGASDPGPELYNSAFITWDEQHHTFDSNGKLTEWTSNSTYAGSAYVLTPRDGKMSIRTSNANTKGVVPSISVQTNNFELINRNQVWTSFPTSNLTIIMVGSGPTTEIPANGVCDGMGLRFGDIRLGLTFNYDTVVGNAVVAEGEVYIALQPIQQPSFKTYTTSQNETYSANTFGITYGTSTDRAFKMYLNGNKVTFSTVIDGATRLNDQLPSPIQFSTDPNLFSVGADRFSSTTSAYFAILVFNRILNDAEMLTLSTYMKKKYFAPKLTYPATVALKLNEALSAPIANTLVSGADPILSYSITPALPTGLVLNTTTGNITGAATISSVAKDYTITATNGVTSNTCILNISVTSTIIEKEAVPVPNITIPETEFTFPLDTNVTTTTPTNTGGIITKFTIDPVNITETTGLVFDSNKGILSGVPRRAAILNVSITASNESGKSVLMFTLITGPTIRYPITSIQSTVGSSIQNMPVSISNGSGAILTFSSTGNLLGLTLDSVTGSIGGTTNASGKSTVTVYAKTPDNAVFASTEITFDIQPTKELKDKIIYVAAGGVAAGAGAITLGVAGYWTYSGKN